jgi:hypothetical protein
MQVKCLFAVRGVLAAALACLGVMFASTPLFASSILYGITQDDRLVTIDTTTAAATVIGSTGNPATVSPIGLASTGGNLYTFNGNGTGNATELMNLNPTTAAVINTLNVGLTGTFSEGDLAFDSSGTGFVASTGFPATGGFYSFSTTTLSPSTIKSPASGATSFDGIAFDALNDLFGLQQGGANLYTLNPSTGTPTVVGSTGITGTVFSFGGLTFASDGTLYGVLSNNNVSDLYTFNTVTGAGTLIGQITAGVGVNGAPLAVGKVDGLAFVSPTNNPPVPEPATLLLVGSGLGLSYWRRRNAMGRQVSR